MKLMKTGKENKRGNTTIVLIVIVIILAGAAIYLFLNYFPQKTSQQQTETQTGTRETKITQPTEAEGKPLPEKDSLGTKELGIVDRYPGSVLVSYSNYDDRESVEYVAKATLDEVKSYYISGLREKGWQVKESEQDSVTFEKGEDTVYIHLYFDPDDKTLEYYIDYIPSS